MTDSFLNWRSVESSDIKAAKKFLEFSLVNSSLVDLQEPIETFDMDSFKIGLNCSDSAVWIRCLSLSSRPPFEIEKRLCVCVNKVFLRVCCWTNEGRRGEADQRFCCSPPHLCLSGPAALGGVCLHGDQSSGQRDCCYRNLWKSFMCHGGISDSFTRQTWTPAGFFFSSIGSETDVTNPEKNLKVQLQPHFWSRCGFENTSLKCKRTEKLQLLLF